MRKTRIKVVELNSGKKEYVCEFDTSDKAQLIFLLFTAFATLHAIHALVYGIWIEMRYRLPDLTLKNIYSPARFNTLAEAESFLQQWNKEQEAIKYAEQQGQVKQVTYITTTTSPEITVPPDLKSAPAANKFRVGRNQHRAILYVETGQEYLLFEKGSEQACQEYCDWLNKKEKAV